jgi:hypothetical protein
LCAIDQQHSYSKIGRSSSASSSSSSSSATIKKRLITTALPHSIQPVTTNLCAIDHHHSCSTIGKSSSSSSSASAAATNQKTYHYSSSSFNTTCNYKICGLLMISTVVHRLADQHTCKKKKKEHSKLMTATIDRDTTTNNNNTDHIETVTERTMPENFLRMIDCIMMMMQTE